MRLKELGQNVQRIMKIKTFKVNTIQSQDIVPELTSFAKKQKPKKRRNTADLSLDLEGAQSEGVLADKTVDVSRPKLYLEKQAPRKRLTHTPQHRKQHTYTQT